MQTEGAKRVLVVDDDASVAQTLQRAFDHIGYHVELAGDGIEALAKLRLGFDLIVLDAEMPGMDGFEVARQIRHTPEFSDLPILMVTGEGSGSARLRAAEAGVTDFLAKPLDLIELRLRSASLLKLKEGADALRQLELDLEPEIASRTAVLRQAIDDMVEAQRATHAAHLDTIRRLVLAAEYKDHITGTHLERIGRFSALLGRGLKLAPHDVELLQHASSMHDIGKVGIPDAILLKPGPLTEAEWEVMRQHTTIGARMLHGSAAELLKIGEIIALSHHEHFDGTGYPNALAGQGIPLFGRICAVVDTFDALTTDRPYRPALPNGTAYEMMMGERERHFDPEVLDVFFSLRPAVEEIQEKFRDRDDARDAPPTRSVPGQFRPASPRPLRGPLYRIAGHDGPIAPDRHPAGR